MPATDSQAHYKYVLFIGPDNPGQNVLQQDAKDLEEVYQQKGLVKGVDYDVFGDGKRQLTEADYASLKGRIGPGTKIDIITHGDVEKDEYIADSLPVSQIFKTLSEAYYAGNAADHFPGMVLNVWGCKCGKALSKNALLPQGTVLMTHAEDDKFTYSNYIVRGIRRSILNEATSPFVEFSEYFVLPETSSIACHYEGKTFQYTARTQRTALNSFLEVLSYLQDYLAPEYIKALSAFEPLKQHIETQQDPTAWESFKKEISKFSSRYALIGLMDEYKDNSIMIHMGRGAKGEVINYFKRDNVKPSVFLNVLFSLQEEKVEWVPDLFQALRRGKLPENLQKHCRDLAYSFIMYGEYKFDKYQIIEKIIQYTAEKYEYKNEITSVFARCVEQKKGLALIRLFLEQKVDPDGLTKRSSDYRISGENHLTPLCHAIMQGDENMVALLLSYEADPSIRVMYQTKSNYTPLMIAKELGNPQIIARLEAAEKKRFPQGRLQEWLEILEKRSGYSGSIWEAFMNRKFQEWEKGTLSHLEEMVTFLKIFGSRDYRNMQVAGMMGDMILRHTNASLFQEYGKKEGEILLGQAIELFLEHAELMECEKVIGAIKGPEHTMLLKHICDAGVWGNVASLVVQSISDNVAWVSNDLVLRSSVETFLKTLPKASQAVSLLAQLASLPPPLPQKAEIQPAPMQTAPVVEEVKKEAPSTSLPKKPLEIPSPENYAQVDILLSDILWSQSPTEVDMAFTALGKGLQQYPLLHNIFTILANPRLCRAVLHMQQLKPDYQAPASVIEAVLQCQVSLVEEMVTYNMPHDLTECLWLDPTLSSPADISRLLISFVNYCASPYATEPNLKAIQEYAQNLLSLNATRNEQNAALFTAAASLQLTLALKKGDTKEISALLDKGIMPFEKDFAGVFKTMLVSRDSAFCSKMFQAFSATVSMKVSQEETSFSHHTPAAALLKALRYAQVLGSESHLDSVFEQAMHEAQKAVDAQLLRSLKKGSLGGVQEALQAGADPNARTASGIPVLHKSLIYGRQDVALCLLENGANPNAHCQVKETSWKNRIHGKLYRTVDAEILAREQKAGQVHAKIGEMKREGKTGELLPKDIERDASLRTGPLSVLNRIAHSVKEAGRM